MVPERRDIPRWESPKIERHGAYNVDAGPVDISEAVSVDVMVLKTPRTRRQTQFLVQDFCYPGASSSRSVRRGSNAAMVLARRIGRVYRILKSLMELLFCYFRFSFFTVKQVLVIYSKNVSWGNPAQKRRSHS